MDAQLRRLTQEHDRFHPLLQMNSDERLEWRRVLLALGQLD